MQQSTETEKNVASTDVKPEAGALSPFLQKLAKNDIGEYVAVHTGSRSYVGRLLSVTSVCVTLDSDSDVLDQPVRVRIDSARIEAVEVLPE